ncbi:hydantoinase B/oxoprolinase family protein [Paraliomyxa miuraensis]|uniref:hydantoinase B/oxoprolinase family protein n=1 Tax=Paraliomyxa miuraensis TaxID=376150 RepID=UPI00225AAAAD|nr:hydantoinase B/oxoprolinase family protein [Paraliomyxa miuraensis]MCX4246405.1 hydantoinase B/oxoprolinase family protein [Paraliomyxa miuraensis]
MSFSTLRDRLPVLAPGPVPSTPWPRIGRGGASFSDDLALPEGGRLGVRVRISDRDGGGYCIDLRDSDERDPSGRFGLDEPHLRTACALALGHALGETPSQAWADRLELLTDPATWIGTSPDRDPAALAFGIARTFDAVLGAFANAWPGRVGAGSCSLGVLVELGTGHEVLITDVLPGGEGGRPDRPGRSAWGGPVLGSTLDQTPTIEGITIETNSREGSGGMGKHSGGDGVVRRYRIQHPLRAELAFDRVRNPPHGIDRAGPPEGTLVRLHRPGAERPLAVVPWVPLELPEGSTLEILTCGGAGWGFPGYGDIEWDPSEWFGSKNEDG